MPYHQFYHGMILGPVGDRSQHMSSLASGDQVSGANIQILVCIFFVSTHFCSNMQYKWNSYAWLCEESRLLYKLQFRNLRSWLESVTKGTLGALTASRATTDICVGCNDRWSQRIPIKGTERRDSESLSLDAVFSQFAVEDSNEQATSDYASVMHCGAGGNLITRVAGVQTRRKWRALWRHYVPSHTIYG